MSCSAQSRSRIKHLLCLCGFRKELVLIYPSILSFLLLHAWFRTLPQMDLYTARTVHLRQPQTWSASPEMYFLFLKVSHSCRLQGPSYCQFLHFQSRILSQVCALRLDCSIKFSCEGSVQIYVFHLSRQVDTFFASAQMIIFITLSNNANIPIE